MTKEWTGCSNNKKGKRKTLLLASAKWCCFFFPPLPPIFFNRNFDFFLKKISQKLEKLVKSTLRKKKIQKISNFFVKKWQSFARKKNTSAKSGYWQIIFVILHWDLYYEAIPRHFTIWDLFNSPPLSLELIIYRVGLKEGELILELNCGWILIHPKLNPNFATSLKLKVIYCSSNEVLQASSGIEKPKITWSLIWRVHV